MCTAGVLADASVTAAPVHVDPPYIKRWIYYRYQACGFTRYLSDSDVQVCFTDLKHTEMLCTVIFHTNSICCYAVRMAFSPSLPTKISAYALPITSKASCQDSATAHGMNIRT